MNDFHRILVASVAVTATHASAILTVYRDKKREISLAVISKYKKCEILLAVSSKDKKYRADRIFDVCRIYGTMSTNTMDSRCQSIHDKKYCQVFGKKQLFVEAYPIKNKYNCRLGLDKFVKEYGAPYKMTYNGAQEQIGRKNKPNIKLWDELTGDDEIFHEKFARVITNEDIPEADDIFDPE